jgi:hypothetical protein
MTLKDAIRTLTKHYPNVSSNEDYALAIEALHVESDNQAFKEAFSNDNTVSEGNARYYFNQGLAHARSQA